jgi:hypothetical protein
MVAIILASLIFAFIAAYKLPYWVKLHNARIGYEVTVSAKDFYSSSPKQTFLKFNIDNHVAEFVTLNTPYEPRLKYLLNNTKITEEMYLFHKVEQKELKEVMSEVASSDKYSVDNYDESNIKDLYEELYSNNNLLRKKYYVIDYNQSKYLIHKGEVYDKIDEIYERAIDFLDWP